MKLFHISDNLNYTSKTLHPRIPESTVDGEDNEIPRICLSDSIEHCFQAIAHDRWDSTEFVVREFDVDALDSDLLNYDWLFDRGYVPDAHCNHEFWYLYPLTCSSMYVIKDVKIETDFTLDYDAIDANKLLNVIHKIVPNFEYKLSSMNSYDIWTEVFSCINKWENGAINDSMCKLFCDMEDKLYDAIIETFSGARYVAVTKVNFT